MGHSASYIIKLKSYEKSTVYDVVKCFQYSGESKQKDHTPSSDKVHAPHSLADLKHAINANPAAPMSVHAKKCHVHRAPNSKTIKDFAMISYVHSKKFILTRTKKVRLECRVKILNKLKVPLLGI